MPPFIYVFNVSQQCFIVFSVEITQIFCHIYLYFLLFIGNRNAVDFCLLILCPEDLNLLISPHSFFVCSIDFLHKWRCYLWMNSYTSSFPNTPCSPLACLHWPQPLVQCQKWILRVDTLISFLIVRLEHPDFHH